MTFVKAIAILLFGAVISSLALVLAMNDADKVYALAALTIGGGIMFYSLFLVAKA